MAKESQEIRIKKRLLEKGLKQTDIANDLGYHPVYINRIIKGKENTPPRFKNWVKQNLGIAV